MTVPRVSVVITSYNHEKFIGDSIRSILEQSYQDFEIVVVDDGSTDGSIEIINNFRDPRVRLEASPVNCGVSITTNRGIAKARGEYVALLASDDIAMVDRLRIQVAFLDSKPDVSAVFSLPQVMDERGLFLPDSGIAARALQLPDFSSATVLKEFFFNCNFLWAPSATIRRLAFDAVGPFDPRMTNLQDFDYWVRLLLLGHALHVLPERLIGYRMLDGDRNLSAPRRDTVLRHHFEYAMILRHYRKVDEERFAAIFGQEFIERGIRSGPVDRQLADLALTVESPAHRWFALETLYETAKDREDFIRWREISGEIDIFGSWALPRLHGRLAALETTGHEEWRQADPIWRELDRQLAQLDLYERLLMEEQPEFQKFLVIRSKLRQSIWAADRSLPRNFNGLRYVTRYRDLFDADEDPFAHYLTYGRREGRDWEVSRGLVVLSPALERQAALLDIYERILLSDPHLEAKFARIKEGIRRSPHASAQGLPPGFNPVRYCCQYADLIEAEVDPFAHYLLHGKEEARVWDITWGRQ